MMQLTSDPSLQEGFYDTSTISGKDELANTTNLTMVSPTFHDLGAESDPDSPFSPFAMFPKSPLTTENENSHAPCTDERTNQMANTALMKSTPNSGTPHRMPRFPFAQINSKTSPANGRSSLTANSARKKKAPSKLSQVHHNNTKTVTNEDASTMRRSPSYSEAIGTSTTTSTTTQPNLDENIKPSWRDSLPAHLKRQDRSGPLRPKPFTMGITR